MPLGYVLSASAGTARTSQGHDVGPRRFKTSRVAGPGYLRANAGFGARPSAWSGTPRSAKGQSGKRADPASSAWRDCGPRGAKVRRQFQAQSCAPPVVPSERPGLPHQRILLGSRELIAGCEKPILILQGQRDIQMTERDAQRLKEANQHAKLVLLPGVNHILKAVSARSGGSTSLAYVGSSEVWRKDPTPPISDLFLFALSSSCVYQGLKWG